MSKSFRELAGVLLLFLAAPILSSPPFSPFSKISLKLELSSSCVCEEEALAATLSAYSKVKIGEPSTTLFWVVHY